MGQRNICRGSATSQVVYLSDRPRHVKHRGSRIALLAKSPVAAAVNMVTTNVVFTAKGMFKITSAFVDWGAFRAATMSVVHTGSHVTLSFDYRKRVARIVD